MQKIVRDPVSGLSHAVGLALALFGAGFLVARARGPSLVSLAIYGVSLVVLYLASSLYHLLPLGERGVRRLRVLDHSAIYLFVAGSATPVLFHALGGTRRVLMLALLWSLAAIGICVKLGFRKAPRALSTAMYVAMGWSVLLVAPTLIAALPRAPLACVVAGGVVYTAGAVVYATKWPNPRPPVFGFHEVWHFFVLGGSVLHFAAIALLCG